MTLPALIASGFFQTDPANISAELSAVPAIYARELVLLGEARTAHKNAKWNAKVAKRNLTRTQTRIEQFVRDTHSLDAKKPTEGALGIECSMHPDVTAADSVLHESERAVHETELAHDDQALLIEALEVKHGIVRDLAKYLASEAISSRNTTV